MRLFLDQGYEQTTIEQICIQADVARRSFFDYFPSKEALVFAWQDDFGTKLAEAVRQRPAGEGLLETTEWAMTETVAGATTPQSLAIAELIRDTPALSARDKAKYLKLESVLADALAERAHASGKPILHARILAAVAIAALRIGEPMYRDRVRTMDPVAAARLGFLDVTQALRSLLEPIPDGLAETHKR